MAPAQRCQQRSIAGCVRAQTMQGRQTKRESGEWFPSPIRIPALFILRHYMSDLNWWILCGDSRYCKTVLHGCWRWIYSWCLKSSVASRNAPLPSRSDLNVILVSPWKLHVLCTGIAFKFYLCESIHFLPPNRSSRFSTSLYHILDKDPSMLYSSSSIYKF